MKRFLFLLFILSGSALADFEKGVAYFESGDMKAAIAEFESAAEKGDKQSMFALGTHYYFGDGVAQDFIRARKYFQESYDNGFSQSAFFLGQIYEEGRGVAVDVKKSFDYYLYAAQQCVPQAQTAVAYFYYKGSSVGMNKLEAAAWLLSAYWMGDQAAYDGMQVVLDELSDSERSSAIARQKELIALHKCHEKRT